MTHSGELIGLDIGGTSTRGLRADVDTSDDRMQKKIRNHTTGKVPFMLLAGERDGDGGACRGCRTLAGEEGEDGVGVGWRSERDRHAVGQPGTGE